MKKQQLPKDRFFKRLDNIGLTVTYEEVRLQTRYSEVNIREIDFNTRFSRNISLKRPIVSAAMDTITGWRMAVAMAQMGGLGTIHNNFTPELQAEEVRRVKRHVHGFINDPVSFQKDMSVHSILEVCERENYRFRTFPILKGKKLVGLMTRNDLDFLQSKTDGTVEEAMTPLDRLITGKPGTTPKAAKVLMLEHRKKKLPIIDEDGNLRGMYTWTDVVRLADKLPTLYNTDKNGNLLVGAAVGTRPEEIERAKLLADAGCDVFVIDSSHGDHLYVKNTLANLKKIVDQDVVVGNISQYESAQRLAKWGADGIKVGQGPGSSCKTCKTAGIGCGQVTAVYQCALAVRGMGIPVNADGGIQYSGDITVALAAGADSVMLGGIFAGTTETPGDISHMPDGTRKYFRGMGSYAAMRDGKGSRQRYEQTESEFEEIAEEGVEEWVPYKGDVRLVYYNLMAGLRVGMKDVGAASIPDLQKIANFNRFSFAGVKESYPRIIEAATQIPSPRKKK